MKLFLFSDYKPYFNKTYLNKKQIKPQVQGKSLNSTLRYGSFAILPFLGIENKKINTNFDRDVLKERNIIPDNWDIDFFMQHIANNIFQSDKMSALVFSQYLKEGKVSLSSNAYFNLKEPKSAAAVKLNPNSTTFDNSFSLDKYLLKGQGVGINFSDFAYPSKIVQKINSFFMFRKDYLNRPPAGIALLDIYNKDILNFITLKNREKYTDWCFDLSVIMDDKFLSSVDNNQKITLSDGSQISAKGIYNALLKSMLKKGEPGIIFSNNKNYLCDPCAALELKEGEGFTLGQVNLSKFTKGNNFDFTSLEAASKILNKALKKIDRDSSYISILGYQEMLDKLNMKYGSKEALQLTSKIIDTIKSKGAKIAISPSGTISRFLKTTPSINPSGIIDYYSQIDTISTIQDKIEGQISSTIHLKKNATKEDIDKIIRYCAKKNIKGITVFKD